MSSKPLIIEPEAENDLEQIRDWYNARRPGLGDDFFLCFEASMDRIRENPKQFPSYFRESRRALTKRFPYLILFVEHSDLISVVGVFHTHRNPATIQRRAK